MACWFSSVSVCVFGIPAHLNKWQLISGCCQIIQLYLSLNVSINFPICALSQVGPYDWFHGLWDRTGVHELFDEGFVSYFEDSFGFFVKFIGEIIYFRFAGLETSLWILFLRQFSNGVFLICHGKLSRIVPIFLISGSCHFRTCAAYRNARENQISFLVFFSQLIVCFRGCLVRIFKQFKISRSSVMVVHCCGEWLRKFEFLFFFL